MTSATPHIIRVVKVVIIPRVLLDPMEEVREIVAIVCVVNESAVTAGSVGVECIVAHCGLAPRSAFR